MNKQLGCQNCGGADFLRVETVTIVNGVAVIDTLTTARLRCVNCGRGIAIEADGAIVADTEAGKKVRA